MLVEALVAHPALEALGEGVLGPQVSITGRLFQTSDMLTPIVVSAPVPSSSIVGIPNTLTAKPKAATMPLTAVPVSSSDQPNHVAKIMPRR
jgi:hypothetical protein